MPIKSILYVGILFSVFCCCKQHKDESPATGKQQGDCLYSRNEPSSAGKLIRVVQSEKFISLPFADSATIELFKGKDFFSGYLSCVSVDTVLGLYFDFTILSEDAFQFYGLIKKNNSVSFILESGKIVEVRFGRTFSGNTNLSKEYTEYSSFAYLPTSAAKQLLTEQLRRVKINWTRKEEEYIVVNPNIFINQLPCVR